MKEGITMTYYLYCDDRLVDIIISNENEINTLFNLFINSMLNSNQSGTVVLKELGFKVIKVVVLELWTNKDTTILISVLMT